MTIYDEIEIEDMDYEEDLKTFFYNCPCGDRFLITLVLLDSRRLK
jgi:diphthamide biosynthesis protein 3